MKKLGRLVLIFGLIGAAIVVYMYNKPHQNYEKMKPDISLTSIVLVEDFNHDEQAANSNYLNKIILVTGKVEDLSLSETGEFSIALDDPMFGVTCHFNSNISDKQKGIIRKIKVGDMISIKGRCDGLLTDVRLSQCFVME